ncbi:LOW QUALITY PROTEIN: rho GTPase-activating protein 21 [Coregonus clupeaformis]|uniref:LOW QUALITY PROTEIN: rho GTPase-activating protein 21 n=1 Tax=Coregonus clupeaformis TaxID=59861 RepID=UPI001E1C7E3E|nr:LOW QUALITY PROTEIN: rho GTPase-activating protein 21 [Coregonus clupeaformis]
MMASRWKGPCDEEERLTRPSLCENNVLEWGERGDSPAGLFNLQGEEEPFSWPGPKTIHLRRTSQGFGFTLRHFIVYPPESAVHPYPFPEEHGRRGRQRNRLEPMDTIFVKQVNEGGPAHGAGLCTGDRIVKVNGESIIGKTYSQVIALIQNSDASLELCVMPKDEDILQLPFSQEPTDLAYSQDAYLRGHSAYSGIARHIPEPPPICYPRVDCKPPGMAQATETPSPVGVQGACRGPGGAPPPDLGYRIEIPVPPSPPPPAHPYPKSQTVACMRNDSVRTVVVPPELGHMGRMRPAHRVEYGLVGPPDPDIIRGRPGSVSHYPLPRKTDIYPSGASRLNYGTPPPHYPPNSNSPNPGAHQNIDWRTYQTYREYIDNKGIHAYGSRTIQERLESLRAASQNTFNSSHYIPQGGWGPDPKGLRRRSTSHDRAYHGPPPAFHHMPPRSSSQDRMSVAERGVHSRNWPPRSVSQDGFTHKVRAHSSDYDYVDPLDLGRSMVDRRGYGSRADQSTRPSRQSLSKQAVHHRPPAGYGRDSLRGAPMSNPALYTKGPEQLQHQPHSAPNMPQDRPYHLGKNISLEQSHTDQRAGVNHVSQSRGRAETMQPPGEVPRREVAAVVGHRSSSLSAPHQRPQRPGILKTSYQHPRPEPQVNGRGALASESGVVLREKPPGSGKNPSPLRHPSYILAVNEEDYSEPVAGAVCWLPNDARREMHMRRLSEKQEKHQTSCSSSNLDESLDSIPFIDELASPSVDHEATSIPASALISAAPAITTVPPSPSSSPCPLMRRQLSHDQESLRNAILESDAEAKQERSKSCDEGLDNYREEGRGRSNSKHMPSLRGLRKALDGYKSSDDSGSRRDSSSDIFSDSSKEGWLNFRQINTEKSKRGGLRSWKQMYAVLRGHGLTLYKDKRDGVSHASSQSDDDPQPISIKACLIDISYSDTKRKNVLRLTTSDCEYLFQAEGRDDMLSWIRVIQENSNLDDENAGVTSQDLISRKIKEYNTMMSAPSSKTEPSPKTSRQSLSIRHTLLGGKGEGKSQSPHSPKTGERDESSPPRDKAAWRRGIPGIMRKPFEKKTTAGVTFGVRLDDCPPAQTNRFVPLIVDVCCKLVEERGLEYTGIYRVPGNNAAISSMQEELDNKGLMSDIDIQEEKWRDLNVISSLLKSFFRKLPEPLFTNEKYADFIEANRTEDSVERLKELKRLILELPDHHYETLKFLSGHLKLVSENCEKNKMEPRNLAIVFGPTLVRTSEDNMTNMVNHMPDQCKIVENLIQQYDWFFTEEGDDDPVTSVEQESTVQSQPVPNIDHLLSNIGRTTTTTSPGEVSDSTCSDSSKSKQGLWGSGKDQCSREMLLSSFFVSRKRKKPKDKVQPSSSDDDLDAVLAKKEEPEQSHRDLHPAWSPESQTEEEEREASERGEQPGDRFQTNGKESRSDSLMSQPSPKHTPSLHTSSTRSPYASPSPSQSPSLGYRSQVTHQLSLSDPPSNYDEVSDLGTMNSTSSQASVTGPRVRHGRTGGLGPETVASGLGAEVSSITSDYSTTSSMTFLTGAELSTLSPEVRSVAESRGGDDADDERSELISEGRPMETDSESDLSVFVGGGKEAGPVEEICQSDVPDAPRPLPSYRLIECDSLSRKKSAARQKIDSESSLDGGRSDKDSNRLSCVLGAVKERSTGSLSSSSRSESEMGTEPAWRLKITDRLKFRMRTSADDMFGVGTQRSRSPEGRRDKKKNIRRRHTMGGQRDFAELSVMGDWQEGMGMGGGSRAELSAVDRLKPKCSSQDFSIREWIARERHRTSNPEVSLDLTEHQGALLHLRSPDPQDPNHPQAQEAPSSSLSDPLSPHQAPAELLNGDTGPQNKSLSLSATAHPHKLSGAQVVHSRFYQYL